MTMNTTMSTGAVVMLPNLPSTPEAAAITHLFQTVGENWRLIVDEWRRNEMMCECGTPFREFYNIGQWKCHQHAMSRDATTKRWPCCGATNPNARGCLRADHRKKGHPPLDYTDTVYIADEVFTRMQVVLDDAILGQEDPATATAPEYSVGVLRFDEKAREALVAKSAV